MNIFNCKRNKIILSISVIAVVGGVVFFNLYETYIKQKPIAKVDIYNFAPGTSVDYSIISGDEVITKNTDIVKKDGIISLPISKKMIGDETDDVIKYKLSMTKPKSVVGEEDPAEMLNILLALNSKTKDIEVSASGLNEYSNIVLEKGLDKKENLYADWAGLFSAKLNHENNNDKTTNDKDSTIKLAFRNSGIGGDIRSLNSGEIEVFFGLFGDNNGASLNDVQTRWSWALIRMTEELTAVMVKQTQIIGMFFDANIQLETQRKMQELMARAHKDYHPSEQMCRIGTFIRSVAHTESKSDLDKHALNKILMNEYLGVENSVAAGGIDVYEEAKIDDYVTNFCDTKDNNGATEAFCNAVTNTTTSANLARLNKDIHYTRTLATKLTLDIDFTDTTATNDEKDIIALAKQLYFPSAFNIEDIEDLEKDPRGHYASRSYAAQMSVAHNSFINIVGMKSSAPAGQVTTTTTTTPTPAPFGKVPAPTVRPAVSVLAEDSGWAYMKAMMTSWVSAGTPTRDFDISPIDMNINGSTTDAVDMTVLEQIDEMLGERPSYYAQMEVLTKKMYQTPNFYTNLYDKPANVKRIGVSLDAITLMNQRDRFESLLRREMLTAVLLESELQDQVEEVNANLYETMQASQISD